MLDEDGDRHCWEDGELFLKPWSTFTRSEILSYMKARTAELRSLAHRGRQLRKHMQLFHAVVHLSIFQKRVVRYLYQPGGRIAQEVDDHFKLKQGVLERIAADGKG